MPPAKKPDYVETTRYVVLTPTRSAALGNPVTGLSIQGITANRPTTANGVVMKVTFRVPTSLFDPFEASITLGEDQVLGSPKAIVADLNKLREELA